MMLKLFKANPVLTTENTCVRSIFQYTLKSVVDDVHADLTEEERAVSYTHLTLPTTPYV